MAESAGIVYFTAKLANRAQRHQLQLCNQCSGEGWQVAHGRLPFPRDAQSEGCTQCG